MTSTSAPPTDPREDSEAAAGGPYPYAMFVRLAGRRCLVVGGGDVAARKVTALVLAGARVKVVAPALGAALEADLGGALPAPEPDNVPGWSWESRAFTREDARGCFLVVAATDSQQVNREVAAAARAHGALVNVADAPESCDFFVPAVVHRGPLQVAVTSGGVAPGLSKRLRVRLEEEFDPGWGEAVRRLGEGRAALLGMDGLDAEARRRGVSRLSALDIDTLLREGGPARVAAAVNTLIQEAESACTSQPSE